MLLLAVSDTDYSLIAALLHNSDIERVAPFYDFPSRNSVRYGDSERGEAIKYGDADVKLCDLAVEVSRCQALAEEFDAMHFRLYAASPVVSAPSSPDGPPETVRGPQGFIAGDRTW